MKHLILLTVVCSTFAVESRGDDKTPIVSKVKAPEDYAAAAAIDFPKQTQTKAIEDQKAEVG